MKTRVVLCYPVTSQLVKQIEATWPDAEVIDAGQERVDQELLDADVFCGHAKVPVDWERVVRKGRLKWIQSSAAGLDHCLVPSVINSDIVVTSASGIFANQVAEQTMALLFGLARSLPTFFHQTVAKKYVRQPTGDVHGKTIGIVGLGGNGRRIAQFLRPLGSKIIATDYYPVDKPAEVDELWSHERLHDLLRQSQVVILALPLNAQTEHVIGEAEFAAMSPDTMFINVARGQCVDEAAMIRALQEKRIWGAGIDVAEVEPLPADSPLWTMDRVIITPHVGAQAASRYEDVTRFFCENVKRKQQQKPLWNIVDKRLGFPAPEHRAPQTF